MALVIDLKPGERVIIGQAVISNDGPRTRLRIDGSAPILRQKDILRPEEARTPCQQLYLLLQLLYLDPEPQRLHRDYFNLAQEIQNAAPSTTLFLLMINEKIIEGSYYKALKEARKLLDHEKGLLADV